LARRRQPRGHGTRCQTDARRSAVRVHESQERRRPGGGDHVDSAGVAARASGPRVTAALHALPREDDKVTRWQGGKVTKPKDDFTLSPCHLVTLSSSGRHRDERLASVVGRHAQLELDFVYRNGRTMLAQAYAEPPFRVGRWFAEADGLHMILT